MRVLLPVDVSDVLPDVDPEVVTEEVSVEDALEDPEVVALALALDVAVDVCVVVGDVISQLRNTFSPRATRSLRAVTNSLHRVASEPGICKMRAEKKPAEHPTS